MLPRNTLYEIINNQLINVFSFIFSSNEHGFGDVNISAILNSFQMGYDKRVRPNYGGKFSLCISSYSKTKPRLFVWTNTDEKHNKSEINSEKKESKLKSRSEKIKRNIWQQC